MENYGDIDFKRILKIIFSQKLIITLIILLSITLGYVYSFYYKKPEYQSSVKILLVADESKVDKEITQSDLTINSSLISTYSNIAKSDSVIEKTIKNLNLNMTVAELKKDVTAKQIDSTQFLKITVTNNNPETAKDIANELSKVFTEQIKEIYNIQNISIIDSAEAENTPSNVNHTKDMAIAVVAGIFISLIMVMMIYTFDDTVKDPKDIEESIKIRSIGTLPVNKNKEEIIVENDPKSNIVESIKTLRTNILYATNKKIILITSAKNQEGKTYITNNLAVAFAEAGKRTILVNSNLREESQNYKNFNIEKGEGLSDFIKEITNNKIANIENTEKYIKETKIPNLYILENGTLPPNPSELITSNNMKKVMETLNNMFDIVLIDSPSCLEVADSIALSSMVEGTILVAENRKTKISDLKKIKKLIEDVNGNIIGVITNKVDSQKGKYYGKKYQYYYSYGDKPEEKIIKDEQKIIPLSEVIKEAKEKLFSQERLQKVKKENLKIEEKAKEQEKLEIDTKDETQEKNQIEEKEILNTKIDYLKEELENLKQNQENTIADVLEKMNTNNTELLEKLTELENANTEISEKINNNNNTGLLEKLEKLENANAEISKKINTDNTKLLEKLEKLESANIEITEKIEKLEVENNKHQLENVAEAKPKYTNVISFEELKEKRKNDNKRTFKINEDISYEDLERLSTCIIDLNKETEEIAFN